MIDKKRLMAAVQPERLLATALALIEIPSPTRDGRAVADRLAEILARDRFAVERPNAGWPQAPAVAARLAAPRKGRTLQFNGHLDTVHLPFIPPRVADGVLYGSGASDMKGGIAAMCEAMRALADTGALAAGGILLTAHDLHESPWGDGSQVNALIRDGYLGDAVLLPEYLSDRLPIIGRGLAILEVEFSRDGEPVHEVLGGIDQPSVIGAGAELIRQFGELDLALRETIHPLAGRGSIFVGQVAAGEIYNQSPTKFRLSGTRRWLPGTRVADVEAEFRHMVEQVAGNSRTTANARFVQSRDAFALDTSDPFLECFQAAHEAVTGRRLEIGAKPFVDDGNAFATAGGIPAITHGPDAKGAHTLNEMVRIDELVRVAQVYALAALNFCENSHLTRGTEFIPFGARGGP